MLVQSSPKNVAQAVVLKATRSRPKGPWELHAALEIEVENHWSILIRVIDWECGCDINAAREI